MRRLLIIAPLLLMACEHPQSAGTKVVYQTVEKEVQRPCPVTVPTKPAKLIEWAGTGGYGERADDALKVCTKS
jgi:hypothetical protein